MDETSIRHVLGEILSPPRSRVMDKVVGGGNKTKQNFSTKSEYFLLYRAETGIYLFCFSGRIHSAVVSGINVETKSVTVEWFERGETKGKEVSDLVG